MTVDRVFPYKVCINLDRRADRWTRMQERLAQHGLAPAERFAAVDGNLVDVPPHWRHTKGAYGCLLSHVAVVAEARRRGAASVLILEDDVVFDDELQTKFAARIGELPADWDMLFFGALHKDEPTWVTDHLVRLTKSNSTYAYALRDTVFDAFIELNLKAENVLDINSFALQQRFHCYCFMPHLAWVDIDHSDAQQRLERHWYLQESLVLFGPEADRLLSDTTIVFAHDSGQPADNLGYLLRYYNEYFAPNISIVLAEQGSRPAWEPRDLPPNCTHIFLPGPFDRERCFRTGLLHSGTRFLMFSDSDLYLETMDFRGNLRMCERWDGATGCSAIVNLNPEDSRRLRNASHTRGIDVTKSPMAMSDDRGCCFFVNRDKLPEPLLSYRESGRFRLFPSPNHALRLSKPVPPPAVGC